VESDLDKLARLPELALALRQYAIEAMTKEVASQAKRRPPWRPLQGLRGTQQHRRYPAIGSGEYCYGSTCKPVDDVLPLGALVIMALAHPLSDSSVPDIICHHNRERHRLGLGH
jgi:hypothetical protein